MTGVLRVAATDSGISYLPHFLADDLGYFRDEGLLVEWEVLGHGPWAARAVMRGEADVGLGGIWRPIMYWVPIAPMVVIAQLCNRCPIVLVGREREPHFRWTRLVGRRVLVPDGAPSPLMALEAMLSSSGVPSLNIKLVRDLVAAELTDLFRAGYGDYYLAAPPIPEDLEQEGLAFPVASLDSVPLAPWSVYYCSSSTIAAKREELRGFVRAIQRSLMWIQEHEPGDAPSLERHYRHIPSVVVHRAIAGAKARDLWGTTIRVDKGALNAYQAWLAKSGLIDQPVSYEELVDGEIADWVAASFAHL